MRRKDLIKPIDLFIDRIYAQFGDVMATINDKQMMDGFREEGPWPDWCLMPVAVPASILSMQAPPWTVSQSSHSITAAYAWRRSLQIYEYDETLVDALVDGTDWTDKLPISLLYRLPTWCPYIALPPGNRYEIAGFFAYLEHDFNHGHAELRITTIDYDGRPGPPVFIDMSQDTIAEAIVTSAAKDATNPLIQDMISKLSKEPVKHEQGGVYQHLPALVALVLYLCAENRDVQLRDDVEGSGKKRQIASDRPEIYDTGYRIGSAYRANATVINRDQDSSSGDGSKAPHFRRAHWHTYWIGPRDKPEQRKQVLHWLTTIPVNVDEDTDAKPTIRPVD